MLRAARRILSKDPLAPIVAASTPPPPPPPLKRSGDSAGIPSGAPKKVAGAKVSAPSSVAPTSASVTADPGTVGKTGSKASGKRLVAYDNDSTDASPSDRDEDAEDTDSPGTSVKASSDSNRRDLNSLFDDVSNEV